MSSSNREDKICSTGDFVKDDLQNWFDMCSDGDDGVEKVVGV